MVTEPTRHTSLLGSTLSTISVIRSSSISVRYERSSAKAIQMPEMIAKALWLADESVGRMTENIDQLHQPTQPGYEVHDLREPETHLFCPPRRPH